MLIVDFKINGKLIHFVRIQNVTSDVQVLTSVHICTYHICSKHGAALKLDALSTITHRRKNGALALLHAILHKEPKFKGKSKVRKCHASTKRKKRGGLVEVTELSDGVCSGYGGGGYAR